MKEGDSCALTGIHTHTHTSPHTILGLGSSKTIPGKRLKYVDMRRPEEPRLSSVLPLSAFFESSYFENLIRLVLRYSLGILRILYRYHLVEKNFLQKQTDTYIIFVFPVLFVFSLYLPSSFRFSLSKFVSPIFFRKKSAVIYKSIWFSQNSLSLSIYIYDLSEENFISFIFYFFSIFSRKKKLIIHKAICR